MLFSAISACSDLYGRAKRWRFSRNSRHSRCFGIVSLWKGRAQLHSFATGKSTATRGYSVYVTLESKKSAKHNKESSLPGLPGMARKRLPAFSVGPLPWLVAPAITGAEFDSSTKNEHETHTRVVLYLQRKEPRSKEVPFLLNTLLVSRTIARRT